MKGRETNTLVFSNIKCRQKRGKGQATFKGTEGLERAGQRRGSDGYQGDISGDIAEPRNIFSKRFQYIDLKMMVPQEGLEPPTPSLRMRCSTS